MKRTGSIALSAFLLFSGSLVAHEGHQHKVKGTVAILDVAAHRLEVTGIDGKTVALKLDDQTKVTRGGKTAAMGDLGVGSRIVVTMTQEKGMNTAVEIRLPEAGRLASPKSPAGQAGATYTCPMHPEVVASKIGSCPKCGMKLQVVSKTAPKGGAE